MLTPLALLAAEERGGERAAGDVAHLQVHEAGAQSEPAQGAHASAQVPPGHPQVGAPRAAGTRLGHRAKREPGWDTEPKGNQAGTQSQKGEPGWDTEPKGNQAGTQSQKGEPGWDTEPKGNQARTQSRKGTRLGHRAKREPGWDTEPKGNQAGTQSQKGTRLGHRAKREPGQGAEPKREPG